MISKDNAGGGDLGNKKSSWSHRLTKKISDLGNESKKAVEVKGKEAKHETSANPPEVDTRKQVSKGWSHRLAAKRGDDARVESEAKPGEGGREVSGLVGTQPTAAPNSANVKKPAWLKKLEELKMK